MLSLILTVTELLVMLGHGRGAAGGEPTLGAAEVGEVVAAGGHAPPALDTRVPETVVDGLEYKIKSTISHHQDITMSTRFWAINASSFVTPGISGSFLATLPSDEPPGPTSVTKSCLFFDVFDFFAELLVTISVLVLFPLAGAGEGLLLVVIRLLLRPRLFSENLQSRKGSLETSAR